MTRPPPAIVTFGPVLAVRRRCPGRPPRPVRGRVRRRERGARRRHRAANDLTSAGVFSIPLTLIILVIAFGALVAAGIPLLLALTAVFTTFGLAGAAQPPAAHRPRGIGGGVADRARGRGRLLHVRPAPRARSGRRGPRPGRDRGRCGDLGPVGADLGADRDGRDGRHVPDERRHLGVVRPRDHDGRGGRDRLPDGAGRAALEAGRQRRAAARAVRQPPGAGGRRPGAGPRS